MPFDLGHDAARLAPALRLLAETRVVAPHLMRRSPDRALQRIADAALQDAVGRQPDRVTDALCFEKLVHLGVGEGRVTSGIKTLHGSRSRATTGSSTVRQPSALCTLPDLRTHRSTSPNWLNTNNGW